VVKELEHSMSHARIAPETSQQAPGGRLARILSRKSLRWAVVIVWLAVIALLSGFGNALSKVTNDSASAYLPASAQSTHVANLEQQALRSAGKPQSDQAIVVFARASGRLTTADLAQAAAARLSVGHLASTLGGSGGSLGAPGPLQPSADGQATVFTANITAPAHNENSADSTAVGAIRRVVGPAASRASDGLQAYVTGSAAISADSGVKSGAQTTLLITAVLIVAVVFVVVYRSPVLWIMPLLSAYGAIVVARSAAHGLANAGLTVSSLSASILIVLVFGAASDYALLLVHRYREELQRQPATHEAMAVALQRTLPTLLASAATVTCGMVCLLAAQSASLHGLGPVGAFSIVSALLAQTTFLPALLLVLGRAAFWPLAPRPGRPGREQSRVWSWIGTRVARRPAPVALAAVVLLGAACAGLAALHLNNDPLSNVKGSPGSITGAQVLTRHYPAGVTAPVDILAPPAQASAALTVARSTQNVAKVAAAQPVAGYTRYTVTLSVPPYGPSGYSAVVSLRQALERQAPGALVGGGPAIQYDITQAASRDTALLFPLILVVILIIIALLLRAVVAPLLLVATTALSFAASFGLSTLVWRALGYSGIQAQLPLYIFVFLVALGVDYNIFLAARIREEARTVGTGQGTLRGLAVTGGVITAAGIVLAATFAALAQLPSVPVAQVGIAVALGVLLDTLLVRTVLVPAGLLTIGNRVWWPSRGISPG
jgi:putative drug exporter of the RND superfamily